MLRSRINQYQGINAHFQSYAINERDGWVSFHNAYITHLFETIDRLLPPGYEVYNDRSLQLHTYDPLTDRQRKRSPEPDVSIWDAAPTAPRSTNPLTGLVATPLGIRSVAETMHSPEETRLHAVLIKEITPDGEAIPVTRIELLSPTNKIGDESEAYLIKRDAALASGTVVVDVDFIHELNSPLGSIPGYASHHPAAYPYTILVSDPRPTIQQGEARFYGFRVDEPLLPIQIPLAGTESILVHFGEVYNRTFNGVSTFSKRADYAKEPVAFHKYAKTDQQRIWARMLAVLEAQRRGQDLAQAPFPPLSDDPIFDHLKNFPQATLMVDEQTWLDYWLAREEDQLFLLSRGVRGEILTEKIGTGETAYQTLKTAFEQGGYEAFRNALENLNG